MRRLKEAVSIIRLNRFRGKMLLSSARSFRTCPRRSKQVVCIDCRQRQNGNMPAELAVRQTLVLERAQNHLATMLGLLKTATVKRTPSERRKQTLGAYTICTGTSGNGVATGSVIIPKVRLAIPLDHVRAPAAWTVAAVGSPRPRFVGRRTGAGSSRRTATTSSASALP